MLPILDLSEAWSELMWKKCNRGGGCFLELLLYSANIVRPTPV